MEKKRGVNVAVSTQIGLPHHADSEMTPHEQFGDMSCFSNVVYVGIHRVESFQPVKLQSNCVHQKMTPQPLYPQGGE